MTTDTRENVFAIAAFAALVAGAVAFGLWHASIIDRAVEAHKAEIMERK